MQIISKEDILNNWNNEEWFGWHSQEYVNARKRNKNVVRDDKYLRENILSKIPITSETLSLKEIKDNWHNEEWWKLNIHNVVYLFDNMYVKKGVTSSGGIYNSWLTRLAQYIITRDAEQTIAELKGYYWNEAGHTYIHTGVATADEVKPDFRAHDGTEVELKVCEDENSIVYHYFKKLRHNFNYVKQYDFHGAPIALFLTKKAPHKLYQINLNSIDDLVLSIGEDIDLDILKTDKGRIVRQEDLPAVPKSLLFGITPAWAKNNKK